MLTSVWRTRPSSRASALKLCTLLLRINEFGMVTDSFLRVRRRITIMRISVTRPSSSPMIICSDVSRSVQKSASVRVVTCAPEKLLEPLLFLFT